MRCMELSARHDISERRWGVYALLSWMLLFAVVAVKVVRYNDISNECLVYAPASWNWWAGRDLYYVATIDGFLYLPQAAILYTPFAWLGHPVGDIVWRLFGLSLFCGGLWRLANVFSRAHAVRVFAVGSFVALFPTFNALRNAQANLPMAGIMLISVADLIERRWWRAAIWLALGFAIKPIILVLILLAAAIYRPMSWRLPVALAVCMLMPFAAGGFHYVLHQYDLCWIKMTMSAHPDRAFSDLRGLLWSLGWMMPMPLYTALQMIAAVGTLWLCVYALRRWPEPAGSAFVLTLCCCYLMLFNPRTEENSYVILTPMIALPAGLLFLDDRRRWAAWVLVALSVGLTGNLWGYKLTVYWLKPLTCVIFVVLVLRELFRNSISAWRGVGGVAIETAGPTVSAGAE